MRRSIAPYLSALAGVAAVAWITSLLWPVLGLASSALLFLLPVLFVAARSGLGPGLVAAFAGTLAYYYFLVPPRFTFRAHGLDNIVSILVLMAVAFVTSRLAMRLKAREAEAMARAVASEESARLSDLLASAVPEDGLSAALAFFEKRYGELRLLADSVSSADDAGFSSLDLSAGAWAMHNGDVTGHGTTVMPAAEWTFIPLAPRHYPGSNIAALARPDGGTTRSEGEIAHLQHLCRLLGQALDRTALSRERQARERLEDGDRLRRAFLASLAHDFRTPLTVITGQLEALAGKAPEAAEALTAARRLDRTMSDLIGAAQIEDGSIHPVMEAVDPVDVIGAACEDVALPAGIALDRAVPADLPFVWGDPVLLHHVLVNLIDNAVRHAVACVTVTADLSDGRLLLSIGDDGPGVVEQDRERIFERFSRLEGSDHMHGSGLGLAIVKGFADAMDIPVSVSTGPAGGACFTLSLTPSGIEPQ